MTMHDLGGRRPSTERFRADRLRADRIRADERGSITPLFAAIFALALVPMVGVGVDVSRAMTVRNTLQDALDATALALAKLPLNTDSGTITATANQWMAANMTDKNLTGIALTVNSQVDQVQISAHGTLNTTIASITGLKTFPVSAVSVAKRNITNIEVALVLDNTGSMAQNNKINNLKTAAGQLVDQLVSQNKTGTNAALKIGIVPFSVAVKVGASHQNDSWITGIQPPAYGLDLFNGAANVNRWTLLKNMNTAWAGCVEDRPMPYDVQDTAATPSNGATMFVPYFAPDEPDDQIPGYAGYDVYANNYLADVPSDTTWQARQGNPAKYKTAPKSGSSIWTGYSLGPNEGCESNLEALMPLTVMDSGGVSAAKAEINGMNPSGNTHIPVGMAWGWHLLSPYGPFGTAAAYTNNNVLKVMVALTDGDNTYNINTNNPICNSGGNIYYCGTSNNSDYTSLGYVWQNRISQNGGDFSNPQNALNDRGALLCSNMKAKNIVIYTVGVGVTDQTAITLLSGCASTSDKYIATDSSGLQAAFAQIASSIGSLRIGK